LKLSVVAGSAYSKRPTDRCGGITWFTANIPPASSTPQGWFITRAGRLLTSDKR